MLVIGVFIIKFIIQPTDQQFIVRIDFDTRDGSLKIPSQLENGLYQRFIF